MVIDELVTLLGFQMDSKAVATVKTFKESIDSVGKYAKIASASLMAAAASVAYFTQQATESAAALYKMHELTGMSAKSLQQWGFAVEMMGGKASSAQADITGLVKSMNPALPGEFNDALFMLGMYKEEYKDIDKLLVGLSQKFKGMNAGEALNWASKAGISEDMLMLLRQGPEAVMKLKGSMPIFMSEQQLRAAFQFQQQLTLIKTTIKGIADNIITASIPAMTSLVNGFNKWVSANKDLIALGMERFIQSITEGFSMFGKIITSVKKSFEEIVPGAGEFFKIITDPKILGGGVALALGGIAVTLGLIAAKFIAIGAVVALVAAALNDFIQAIEGVNDTAFGRLFNAVGEAFDPNNSNLSVSDYFSKIRNAARAPSGSSGERGGLLAMKDSIAAMGQANVSVPSFQTKAEKTVRDMNNTFNITSTDPKGAAAEVESVLERFQFDKAPGWM